MKRLEAGGKWDFRWIQCTVKKQEVLFFFKCHTELINFIGAIIFKSMTLWN